MTDLENRQAEREAMETSATAPPSSRRADIWAGMMRYLSGEANREKRREQREERTRTAQPKE